MKNHLFGFSFIYIYLLLNKNEQRAGGKFSTSRALPRLSAVVGKPIWSFKIKYVSL
jgi:hypothetical protein